jgi:hypothetical protein
VTQDQNVYRYVTENSVIHIDRAARSLYMKDFPDSFMRMTEFSVTLMFWSCVTLGFSNSVADSDADHLILIQILSSV